MIFEKLEMPYLVSDVGLLETQSILITITLDQKMPNFIVTRYSIIEDTKLFLVIIRKDENC